MTIHHLVIAHPAQLGATNTPVPFIKSNLSNLTIFSTTRSFIICKNDLLSLYFSLFIESLNSYLKGKQLKNNNVSLSYFFFSFTLYIPTYYLHDMLIKLDDYFKINLHTKLWIKFYVIKIYFFDHIKMIM